MATSSTSIIDTSSVEEIGGHSVEIQKGTWVGSPPMHVHTIACTG